MTLTKDGILTVHGGYSFSKPIDRSWLITPNSNNSLVMANKQNGGVKFDSQGAIIPLKYTGKGKGGPLDLSTLCMKNDGAHTVYGGLCGD